MNIKTNLLTMQKNITRRTFYQRKCKSSFNLKDAAIGGKNGGYAMNVFQEQFREFEFNEEKRDATF